MSSKSFTGIQIDAWSYDDTEPAQLLDDLLELVPLNAVVVLNGNRVRRGPQHHGGTHLRQPVRNLDKDGRDFVDLLQDCARERGVEIIIGAGEETWGYRDDYPGYTTITMVDCYGRANRQSCKVAREWRRGKCIACSIRSAGSIKADLHKMPMMCYYRAC